MEDPQPLVSYRTTQLRRDSYRQRRKSAPLFPPKTDSEARLALYSTSWHTPSHQASTGGDSTNNAVEGGASKSSLDDVDPILAHITAKRSRLGLETTATKNPESEAESCRASLLASSGPVTGIRDLKALSKKLASFRSEHEGGVGQRREREVAASDFVYALRRESTASAKVNPYDLYIVSAEVARRRGRYYTISAFSIAEVCEALEVYCCSVLFYSIPFHPVPFHSIRFSSGLLWSVLFCLVQFWFSSVLFCSGLVL